jgi:hypothetical protein
MISSQFSVWFDNLATDCDHLSDAATPHELFVGGSSTTITGQGLPKKLLDACLMDTCGPCIVVEVGSSETRLVRDEQVWRGLPQVRVIFIVTTNARRLPQAVAITQEQAFLAQIMARNAAG